MGFSKHEPTVESSVFGAKFLAMKNGSYKLRMMDVPLSGPTYVYGDNMSVVHTTHSPASILKKI
jgi:hypothetical protein